MKKNPSFTANILISEGVQKIGNNLSIYRKPINKNKGLAKCIKNYAKALFKKGPGNISHEEVQQNRINSYTRSFFPEASKHFADHFESTTEKLLPGKVEIIPVALASKTESTTLVSLKYTDQNGKIIGPTLPSPLTSYIPSEPSEHSWQESAANILHDINQAKLKIV